MDSSQVPNPRNYWYPLCFSKQLRQHQLMPQKLFGIPLVLFRDREGLPRCLVDLCPHQAASFRLGRVVDGTIQCPLHHWRFDGAGQCVEGLLLNPEDVPKGARCQPLPTKEMNGFIYIYPGNPDQIFPLEQQISSLLEYSGVIVYQVLERYEFDAASLMINSSDSYHFYGLHRHNLKFLAPPEEEFRGERPVTVEEASARLTIIEKSSHSSIESIYNSPFSVSKNVDMRGMKMIYEIYATPYDQNCTLAGFRFHFHAANPLMKLGLKAIGPLLFLITLWATRQDIPVLRSQRDNRSLAAQEYYCRFDRAIVAYKKFLSKFDLANCWFKDFRSL